MNECATFVVVIFGVGLECDSVKPYNAYTNGSKLFDRNTTNLALILSNDLYNQKLFMYFYGYTDCQPSHYSRQRFIQSATFLFIFTDSPAR